MKFKATKKQMRDNYARIISIGYCGAQSLLRYEREMAYSSGSNGWACDYYEIDGVLISTGYAPLADKNARHDYDLLESYESRARAIVSNYSKSYEEQKAAVQALLREFVRAVTE
jgi:hypothetical protein